MKSELGDWDWSLVCPLIKTYRVHPARRAERDGEQKPGQEGNPQETPFDDPGHGASPEVPLGELWCPDGGSGDVPGTEMIPWQGAGQEVLGQTHQQDGAKDTTLSSFPATAGQVALMSPSPSNHSFKAAGKKKIQFVQRAHELLKGFGCDDLACDVVTFIINLYFPFL